MKKISFLIIMLFAINLFAQVETVKVTKAQQEVINKAKPINEELKMLKAAIYDANETITKAEDRIKVLKNQLELLQNEFSTLPKEEPKATSKPAEPKKDEQAKTAEPKKDQEKPVEKKE